MKRVAFVIGAVSVLGAIVYWQGRPQPVTATLNLAPIESELAIWQPAEFQTTNDMFATTRAGKRVDFFVQTRTYNIQEPMTSVKSRVDALTKDWGTPEIAAPNEFWRLHNVPDVIAGGYVSIRLIPGKRTISIGKGREGTESTWTTLEIEEYRPRTNSDPANEPGRGTVVINHINPAMSKVIQPISS